MLRKITSFLAYRISATCLSSYTKHGHVFGNNINASYISLQCNIMTRENVLMVVTSSLFICSTCCEESFSSLLFYQRHLLVSIHKKCHGFAYKIDLLEHVFSSLKLRFTGKWPFWWRQPFLGTCKKIWSFTVFFFFSITFWIASTGGCHGFDNNMNDKYISSQLKPSFIVRVNALLMTAFSLFT